VAQGELIEGKVLGAACCEGLSAIENSSLNENDECVPLGPPSVQVCAACGDGKCQSGENKCNCPADCG
ncbi:MAG: hypothetical protein WBW88_19045, partial [Rhodothermales bacterium]